MINLEVSNMYQEDKHWDQWSRRFGYWWRWHHWPLGHMTCKISRDKIHTFIANGEFDFY